MVVGKTLGVCLGAGGVAELHVGEFLGGLNHIVLMTEGVCEDNVAAGISQVSSSLIAAVVFGNVLLHDELNAQLFASFLGSVQEVQVIGGVLVVQEDEANLHLGGVGLSSSADGEQAYHHYHSQNQGKNLFHVCLSPFWF